MSMIEVKITRIVDEAQNVKSFWLERKDGTALGKYSPGAHIDVVGPTAITRQYSLCSTPDAGESFSIAVKRESESRGGSQALHELEVGDTLQISEPRNLLEINQQAAHHVLVAAGIGITPMLSMARYMDVHSIPFDLYYFSRNENEAAFLPLLAEKCPEKLHSFLGVKREAQDEQLRKAFEQMPDGAHVYTCGPAGFMEKVVGIAEKFVDEDAIHLENFHAAQQPGAEANTEFEVELEGETYTVPADKSIFQVLEENDCDVDTSCEEGICGTCIMRVLTGTPEHRDSVLSAAEKNSGEVIAVCVSRSKSAKLVLDYD